MKRIIKIFFVLLFAVSIPTHGSLRNCSWDEERDQEQIFLEQRYQQVRLEHQITIVFMLALLESNKLLLLKMLEHQTDLCEQTIMRQSLRETELKINVLRKKLDVF